MLVTYPPSKFPRLYLYIRNSNTKMSFHKAVPFGSADTQKSSTVADQMYGCANESLLLNHERLQDSCPQKGRIQSRAGDET